MQIYNVVQRMRFFFSRYLEKESVELMFDLRKKESMLMLYGFVDATWNYQIPSSV